MNRTVRILVALVLSVVCVFQMTFGAYAASKKTDYVSEVILSYGNTADEAKKWLTNNGYSYVDRNLNEGADDPIFLSKERAVYMGYKVTEDPEKAITDMKLMNMNGGYSVQDYQMILEEKKTDIQQFINQFIAIINEYRINYKNESSRAKSAYEMLNMLKEDDTGMLMGDLLLNKIKEEYSDGEFASLSAAEQKKHADMTTILMQGNINMVLCIEQILSCATDTNDTLWLDRLADAQDYDTMLETVMDEENVDPAKAEQILASRYDEDAKIIAGMAPGYRNWLKDYTDAEVKLTDDEKKVESYLSGLNEEQERTWYLEGAQYELLDKIPYDEETSLLDLFISDDFDLTGDDVVLLYPIVSILSEGQRASLDFLFGYQLFAMGCNTESVAADVLENSNLAADEKGSVSVYEGVDRSIFGDEVALTSEAARLQNSDNQDYSANWFEEGLSTATKVIGIVTVSAIAFTVGAWVTHAVMLNKSDSNALLHLETAYQVNWQVEEASDFDLNLMNETKNDAISYSYWSDVFFYTGIGLTVVSVIMSGVTLWCAYDDLKDYYHTDFTPIPLWMVDQAVNEKDEKTFTYYKVVNCNRIEGKFTADNTKLLKSFGDVNGDVGKQWVALYTTTDKAAGDPIVADFITQVGKSTIPGEYTALSLFGNESAQNLTDEKSGFTYNDDLGGIYLFYNTDASAFAGSAITTGTIAIAAGCVAVAAALIVFFVYMKKKAGKAKAD